MTIETRDQAREKIAESGITVKNVSPEQLVLLRNLIDNRMVESGNYRGTYRMDADSSLFMTCSTNQWESREAVSFNRDGFIGLAGWADNNNIKPILLGIEDWLTAVASGAE